MRSCGPSLRVPCNEADAVPTPITDSMMPIAYLSKINTGIIDYNLNLFFYSDDVNER